MIFDDRNGLESLAEVDKGRLRRKGVTRRGVLNAFRIMVVLDYVGEEDGKK